MGALDIRTVFLANLLGDIVCTAFLALLWRRHRGHYEGLGYLLADYGMRLAASVLILMRGRIHDFASMVVANGLIMAGAWALLVGLERFLDKRGPQTHNAVMLTVFVGVHAYFTLGMPDLTVRNINVAAGVVFYCLQTSYLLLRRSELSRKTVVRGLAALVMAYCLLGVLRVGYMLSNPGVTDLFKSGPFDTMMMLLFGMLNVALGFGLYLLVNQRLEDDRTTAESQARTSDERYKLIVETASEGICLMDADLRITWVNANLAGLAGVTQDEMLGRRVSDFMHAVEQDAHRCHAEERRAGKRGSYDLRVQRPDGRETWVHVSSAPIRDGEGSFAGSMALVTDISERVAAAKALRASEEKYRTLIETTDTGFLILDGSGCVLDANAEYVRLAGAGSLEEIRGRCVVEWTAPHHRERNRAAVEQCVRDGRVRNLGVDYLDAKSRAIPVEINATVANLEGQPRIISLVRDISERRRYEDLLREEKERFMDIANSIPVFLIAFDPKASFAWFNDTFVSVLGWSPDEARGRDILEHCYPDPETRKDVLEFMGAADGSWREFKTRVRDGRILDTAWCSIRLKDGTLIGIGQDVTDKKRSEREIVEARAFLSSVVENVPNMIFVKDARDLRFVMFNRAGEELLGTGREKLIGKCDHDFFPKEQADFFASKDREVLAQGSVIDISEEPITTMRGEARVLHTKKVVVRDSEGKPQYLLGISEDITERNRMEQSLLQMQKLESLGLLAEGIAHDFNNMLTGIMGNLSLLREKVGGPEPAELLEEAEEACHAAKGLARQLLTFASGGDPIKEHRDVVPIVRTAAQFAVRGTSSRCLVSAEETPLIAGVDKDQLSQVIQNLVLNAVQSMPSGGEVRVSLRPAEEGGVRLIRIEVRDQGVGIPAAILTKVFDPYFSTKGKGRGLGLAVCHSIVAKHGGRIEVESAAGLGTAFILLLPASGAEPPQPVSAGQALPKGLRVLVMDDDASVARVLERMLSRLGCSTQRVVEGRAALAAYREAQEAGKPFDAVIMDMTIVGGMGGKETAQELKRLDPGARIIVSSGYAQDPAMADPAAYGFAEVLPKPYRLEDLAGALFRLLA